MKYDFENKAVRCETWEEMKHLEQIAVEQGLSVCIVESRFVSGEAQYLAPSIFNSIDLCMTGVLLPITETEISYSDFISNNNTKK